MLKRGDIVYFKKECDISYLSENGRDTYVHKFEVGLPYKVSNVDGYIILKKDDELYPLFNYVNAINWYDLLCSLDEWRDIQIKKLIYD